MAILASQATRRDAKSYFGRFGKDLYPKTQGRDQSSGNTAKGLSKRIHIAVVKVCQADTLCSVDVLPGLAKTLLQLGRLGMPVCLVIEPEDGYMATEPPLSWSSPALREKYSAMAYRIADAIEAQGGRAQPILGEFLSQTDPTTSTSQVTDGTQSEIAQDVERSILRPPVTLAPAAKKLLHDLMKRSQIPIVAPIAGGVMPSLLPISADCAMYRICQGFSLADENSETSAITIARVIIVDPIGGLPAPERRAGSHIYINLRQEYDRMIDELTSGLLVPQETRLTAATKLHLRNLILVKMCLASLNPTSSGLITTPAIASATASESKPQSLIHNLLTDKPLISPSLPRRRLTTPISDTTLLRTGLPVAIYQSIDESEDKKSAIDYERLVRLIEDSFGRRLDSDHYRNRIREKTAAIIVVGDYEGAAIVTKESGASSPPDTWVPYLDKFAVSTKSQGSGGVADIVFNVLVSLFPNDLIWRSRRNNPVNKWVCNFSVPHDLNSLTTVLRASARDMATARDSLESFLDIHRYQSGQVRELCRYYL